MQVTATTVTAHRHHAMRAQIRDAATVAVDALWTLSEKTVLFGKHLLSKQNRLLL